MLTLNRFTLWGLSQYDETLFDDIVLPSEIDKTVLVNNIMDKSGDLYMYYQSPMRAKAQINNFFLMHYDGFKRMIEVLIAEYNPIENTDRYEDETQTDNRVTNNTLSGTDSNISSGSDALQRTGKDENKSSDKDSVTRKTVDSNNITENEVSAFDSGDYQKHDKTTVSINEKDETTYGRKDTTTYGSTDTTVYGKTDSINYGKQEDGTDDNTMHRVLHTHGNIGTTTNQQMVSDELALRVYNLYDVIAQMFEDDILIQIY